MRRSDPRTGETGADDDDLELPLVVGVHQLHVGLVVVPLLRDGTGGDLGVEDRKSTRLNSSH